MKNPEFVIGVSSLHYVWHTLEEAFCRAKELSFALIEFSTTCLAPEDYEACGRLAEETGMQLSLHAWGNLAAMSLEEALQELKGLQEACAQMQARYLIMHLGTHIDRARGLRHIVEIGTRMAPAFEKSGLLLCLENHYPYEYKGLNELGGTPEDFIYLFSHISSPAVRFCLDFGHSHMAQNTEAFLVQLAPYLAYVHIADNHGEHDEHLAAGDGTIDWPSVLARTLQLGFRGPFVLEFPELNDPARFARFGALLQAAVRNLENSI